MAELGLSIVGLAGLFTTCLEGYRICLSVSSANKDSKLLRMRVYLERERFLNIGRTCGLVEHRGVQGSRQALQQFLDEDDYRRRAIGEILDLIATLLSEAETLDRKYATLEIAAPPSDDNDDTDGWRREKFRSIRNLSGKVAWSMKDKAAYAEILEHLRGFNEALEGILPGPLQEFLKSVLPATVCANPETQQLTSVEEAFSHDRIRAQAEWSVAVRSSTGVFAGPKVDARKFNFKVELCKGSRNIGDDGMARMLIDWTSWERESQARAMRFSEISGILRAGKGKALRLFPCAGYVEEQDPRSEKTRYGLAYEMPANNQKGRVRSLLDILATYEAVQVPPLEHRLELARTLCRAMLLWHSSGWVHHDFRSHNIIFLSAPSAVDGVARPKATDCQGVEIAQPYLIGFGHARSEEVESIMSADKKAVTKTFKQQRRYWSPDYLASSASTRTSRSFQRSHDIYSLGCVLLELGIWKPLDSYGWDSAWDDDHKGWYKRLLREEGKLRARCGSIYTDVVLTCLKWATSDLETDVQVLAFEILLQLEKIKV